MQLLLRWTTSALLGVATVLPGPLAAQAPVRLREPLPLDVALSLHRHNSRSPINLSPDGGWIAHTVQTDDNVPRDSVATWYSASGFPFAEGDARMEATVTNVRTGEAIRLGGARSTSWAPVWSPDGVRVAFYSDEGGEAGLWIWEKATRTATRFPGVIVRPQLGFDGVRWSADGQRVIAKILPVGVTIAQANAKDGARRAAAAGLTPATPGQASVIVRRHDPLEAATPSAAPAPDTTKRLVGDTEWAAVDLALMDIRTKRVTRLVERTAVQWYAWSPDERSLAYTVKKGWEANSGQSAFDLVVFDLPAGSQRVLAANLRLGYGIEWSWSPDGRTIAYIESGQLGSGQIVILPIGGTERRLQGNGAPSFDPGDGEHAPLWSADGTQLFAVGGDALWRFDARSGQGSAVGTIPEWRIRAIVTPFGRPAIWSSDGGRTVWVVTRERRGTQAGLHAIDLKTGQTRAGLLEEKSYSGIFNLTASDATGELAFVSRDQQRLQDIWMFDTRGTRVRQASRINPGLDRYELGSARLIAWRGVDSQPLRGTLLFPPDYVPGRRVPLVVDVYGGAMGSAYVNAFGGRGGENAMFNMHVLATRGYAVLFPDAPLRRGRASADLLHVVMAGVDAAIDSGYADPDRLAVMGQSYGSLNTLALITQTTRFKAAVITGVVLNPDLFTDYLNNTGYYEHGQGNMGGTIWEQRDRYFENSPLFRFDRITTPLLMGQGDRDGNLIPSNAIFTALERLGKPVEFRLYQSERHVLSQKANVRDFWERRLDFLSKHLDVALDSHGRIIFEGGRAKSAR